MKRIITLFCLVCLMCACEKAKTTENVIANEEEAMALVLQSIDELNASYGYVETRSIPKEYAVATADAAGTLIGRWAGKHVGAGIGVITGNPVIGVVGYVGGRKFGGWAGYVLASALAKELCPGRQIIPNNPFVLNSLPYSATGLYLLEDLSSGDVHNFLLDKFVETETAFFTPEGTVNSEELFDELQGLADEYNVEDPLLSIEPWKETMAQFYEELAVIMNNAASNNEDPEITVSNMQKAMENIGVPAEETQVFCPLMSKLISCAATLRPNRVKSYERDYVTLINASKVSMEKKLNFIDIGSVAIMSSAYWNAE